MTISSTVRKAGPFAGHGTTSEFPFEFKVFSAEDLYVVQYNEATNLETVLALDANYTVTLNADQNEDPGGTVELTSNLPTGYTLTITSDIGNLQPTDLTNRGGFYPSVINDALDRSCIQIQQLAEDVSRAVKVALSSEINVDLPHPTANELIGWDATATNLVNINPSTIATVVAYATAYADTFEADGVTTDWVLTRNPAVLYNLDVSIAGVTQVPVTDYTLSGKTFSTTSPAPAGAIILVKYKEGLPNYEGDAQDVRYVPSGTGAVETNVAAKLRETVSVKDFGAVGDGVTDDTAAIQAAIDSMAGSYQPTVLTNLNPGSTLFFPAGVYKITAPLVVTKSCSRLIGDGWNNTILRYGGSGLITEIIVFRDSNNSELSYMRLDGNASSGTQGAKACLGIDLAAFFTSHDVYMTGSTLYGLRASHLWESYFENLYIRGTGQYSTVGTPGAAVCFTSADAISTVFPGHESNNTTFVKPTFAPFGGLVRVDASAGATDNLSFLDSVAETDVDLPATQRDENAWHLEGANNNFQIKGGFYTSNNQTAAGSGFVFYAVTNWEGGGIRDYTVSVRKSTGFSRHARVANIASYNKIEIQNLTVVDRQDLLTDVINIGGYAFISSVVGSIMYRCSGTPARTADFVFADATTRSLFNGVITVQNGDNTSPGNNTSVANLEGNIEAACTTAIAQSLPNATTTIVNYSTKEYDVKNLVTTGAAWKYTAPFSGKYRVSAQIGIDGAANTILSIFKNNAEQYRTVRQLASGETISVNSTMLLAAGDYIDARAFVNQVGISLLTSSGYNRISIELVAG